MAGFAGVVILQVGGADLVNRRGCGLQFWRSRRDGSSSE
jgi:hypothetical protein